MDTCLFCKIVSKEIPSSIVYEDDRVLCFKDINPMAKTHVLVIPKQHIASLDCVDENNSAVVTHIFETIPKIAKQLSLSNGYRVVSNCGDDACQSVHHLHFHILGGEPLNECMA